MKCLVIAAGKGTRLSHKGDSKPLIPLLGLSLIERVILTANRAGVTDFCVVTGFNGEKVRKFLDGLAQRKRVNITHVVNEEWEKGNGVSVLKAREALDGEFLLLMADHLVDESALRKLIDTPMVDCDVLLGVDHKLEENPLVDGDEATKVFVEAGFVKDIGKDIAEHNGYDTGMFRCTPGLFDALEESASGGDGSLSAGVRLLARQGRVRAVDIGESLWVDVDDEVSFARAERYLLSGLKKPTDGPISRNLNRPLSTQITKLLVKTPISPNFVSFLCLALSLVGAFFFMARGYLPLAIGAVLAQLSSIVDGCDGEIARLKFLRSDFGGWLDSVLDRYADAFLLFGISYHVYATNPSSLVLLLGFLAIAGTFVNSYTADKFDGFMVSKLAGNGNYLRMGRDVRLFILFAGGVLNLPLAAIFLVAVLMNAENVRRIVMLYEHEKYSLREEED